MSISPPAHGDSPTFVLHYQHDETCPDSETLLDQLRSRTDAGTRVQSTPADLDVRVDVRSGDPASGVITWTEKGELARREVRAHDCSEVVSALALVLALVLDSDAKQAPAADAAPPAPHGSVGVPAPMLTPPEPLARSTSQTRIGFGVSGGLVGGIAPSATFASGLFAQLAWDRSEGLSPMVRLEGLRGVRSTSTRDGSFEMRWWTARLSGCPTVLRSSMVFVSPCGSFDFGRLQGRGYDVRDAAESSATWYGPGAHVLAGTLLLDALTITLDGGAVFPLARDRFVFAPDRVVHELPVVAGFGMLSVGGEL